MTFLSLLRLVLLMMPWLGVILTLLGNAGQLQLSVLLLLPFVCLVVRSLPGGWMLFEVKPVSGLFIWW